MTRQIFVRAHYRSLGPPRRKWVVVHLTRSQGPQFLDYSSCWTENPTRLKRFFKREAKAFVNETLAILGWSSHNCAQIGGDSQVLLLAVR